MPIERDLKPGEKWTFDAGVSGAFDDMLARSIPQYDLMRRGVFDLASKFVETGTDVVDLGCSQGEALRSLVDRFGARVRFVGVDASEPMIEEARRRFASLCEAGIATFRVADLRDPAQFPKGKASVVLSILTLQFVPIEHRLRMVRQAFKVLRPGGAMVVVEKVLGATAELDEAMVDLHIGLKRENGYTQDEIDRKKLSLEGVLVPVTARWNEEILRSAGFSQVDCWWRWMNFAGWLAVKEP